MRIGATGVTLLRTIQPCSGVFLLNGRRTYFPGLKPPGLDVDHSPPSSSEVKNEWSYASTPHIFLQGVNRDLKLYFYLHLGLSKTTHSFRFSNPNPVCISSTPYTSSAPHFHILRDSIWGRNTVNKIFQNVFSLLSVVNLLKPSGNFTYYQV
jgi:hypothetical protein